RQDQEHRGSRGQDRHPRALLRRRRRTGDGHRRRRADHRHGHRGARRPGLYRRDRGGRGRRDGRGVVALVAGRRVRRLLGVPALVVGGGCGLGGRGGLGRRGRLVGRGLVRVRVGLLVAVTLVGLGLPTLLLAFGRVLAAAVAGVCHGVLLAMRIIRGGSAHAELLAGDGDRDGEPEALGLLDLGGGDYDHLL